MNRETFYVTTPIYYVNDVPHIGHAYTTIIADTLARYARLRGKQTFFLTGTDEHGQKIEEAAKSRGKTPQEYADEISGAFKELWDDFGISYDKYIRTTDEEHMDGVREAFKRMLANGDIYKGEYEGHYCISCETFFTETQLIDGDFCPDCGKPTTILKEESYFFKLSKYAQPLLDWYNANDDCILPKSRKNEVARFVEAGLNDLSITRTTFDWGVKLPKEVNDPKHVVYVWLDALFNYATALGFGGDEKEMLYFPADYHLMGKDILRFHAIFWPAFLMSLEMPLPKHIGAHGWWTRDGAKMSKSRGNVIRPKEVADAYGLDSFRYFMLREVPFGQDGDFGQRSLIDRINNDLGNDLGNLLNRVIGMTTKYFDGKITSANVEKYFGEQLAEAEKLIGNLDGYMTELQTNRYLEELWRVISIGNKSIEVSQPWAKMKEGKEEEVAALLGLVSNLLGRVALLLHPVMPEATVKIAGSLQFQITPETFARYVSEGQLLPDFAIQQVPPLFPKVEEPLLEEPTAAPVAEPKKKEEKKGKEEPSGELIDVSQFFASDIRVGLVVSAEEVPKSKKLLLLQVDLGEESPRQIVAGIKEYYSAESLVNTKVCVVANLKPAKLMGYESQGMVLAAKDGKSLTLVRPEGDVGQGSKVS